MTSYLPVIIGAVIIMAILLWWLLARNGAQKTVGQSKDIASSPPAAPVAKATAAPKLMDGPAPAKKTVKAKVKAPLKAAATKAAPAAVAKPVAAKAKTAKVPAPKAASKAAAPKPAAPKPAAKPVVKKTKAEPAPKSAPKTVAAKAKAEVAPKPKVAKPAAKAKVAVPDNLELLKGLGPKVNTMLKSLGVTSFAQVASWTTADVAEIDGKLGAFAGRISRDNWIDQAKYLVAGDVAGFEKKYGALGSAAAKG
jgi:predicted flap endonuclease-1-like 5' DNA nuclease